MLGVLLFWPGDEAPLRLPRGGRRWTNWTKLDEHCVQAVNNKRHATYCVALLAKLDQAMKNKRHATYKSWPTPMKGRGQTGYSEGSHIPTACVFGEAVLGEHDGSESLRTF